jgi:hypothetical protein
VPLGISMPASSVLSLASRKMRRATVRMRIASNATPSKRPSWAVSANVIGTRASPKSVPRRTMQLRL